MCQKLFTLNRSDGRNIEFRAPQEAVAIKFWMRPRAFRAAERSDTNEHENGKERF
jgi:hypothetical protein